MSKFQKLLLCVMLGYSPTIMAEPQWLLKLEQSLEDRLLLRLAQAQQDVKIHDFTTDGCSGGLSEAWVFLGAALPRFAENFGQRPVWEDCCVTHDKSYWSGDTAGGFHQRLAADNALRQCVQEYGPRLAAELGARYNISTTTVTAVFNTAGDMMYQAVRIGGKPCTFLPWRWGYGWPQCPLLTK